MGLGKARYGFRGFVTMELQDIEVDLRQDAGEVVSIWIDEQPHRFDVRRDACGDGRRLIRGQVARAFGEEHEPHMRRAVLDRGIERFRGREPTDFGQNIHYFLSSPRT